MDIKTERGQQTLRDEQDAALIWEQNFPAYQYVQTPKDQPALVDAMLVKDKVIMYCVETKCRYDMTLNDLFTHRNGEWLVTYEKISKAKQIALGLGVPLIGFLYLVPDKILLTQKLTDALGNFVCKIRTEDTETQRTVNGGVITRKNAFIDMDEAKILMNKIKD